MKNLGLIITIIGLIGIVYFGIDLMTNDAEVNFLGVEVSVKERNYTPIIISGIVFLAGLFVMQRKK